MAFVYTVHDGGDESIAATGYRDRVIAAVGATRFKYAERVCSDNE